jgi:hypothetical protein
MNRYAPSLVTLCILLLTVSLASPGACLAAENDVTNRTVLVNTASSWLPGDRIRITSPEPYRVYWTGWFTSLESDSVLRMRISRTEDPVAVRLHQIGTLEEKIGGKRHPGTGAGVGCLVGLLIGAMMAPSEDPEIPIDGLGTFRMRGLGQSYIVVGGVAGLVLGGAIGYTIKSDRWGIVARFD